MTFSLWYSIHAPPPITTLATVLIATERVHYCTGGLVDKITPVMQATYYAFMQEGRTVDDIATNRTGGARERPCKVCLLHPAASLPPPRQLSVTLDLGPHSTFPLSDWCDPAGDDPLVPGPYGGGRQPAGLATSRPALHRPARRRHSTQGPAGARYAVYLTHVESTITSSLKDSLTLLYCCVLQGLMA